jgi:hypothetical protein
MGYYGNLFLEELKERLSILSETFQFCLKTKKKCLNFWSLGIFLYLCHVVRVLKLISEH